MCYIVSFAKDRSSKQRAVWYVLEPAPGKGKSRKFAVSCVLTENRWYAERIGPTTGRPDIVPDALARRLIGAVKEYNRAFDDGMRSFSQESNPHEPETLQYMGWRDGRISLHPEPQPC